MRRLFLILGLTLCAAPASATFSSVQQVTVATCTATSQTCAVTVASTGTGHLLIGGMIGSVSTEFITSVSGGGTWTAPSGCEGSDGTTHTVSCAYSLASTSGATSITFTRTSTATITWRVWVAELSFTGSSVAVDTGNSTGANRDQTTATTTPAGVTLTINGSNGVIFQVIHSSGSPTIAGGTCSGTNLSTSGAYFLSGASSNGAFSLCGNTTSGTAPTWTTGSSRAALGAIAFAEAGGLTTPTCSPTSGNPPQTVSCTIVGGATGCYTLNGAAPTATTPGTCDAGSTTYTGSISITVPTVLQILATESGFSNSNVATYTYGTASVVFTAVASGDWQATATWGTSGSGCHIAYPCQSDAASFGDQAVIGNFTVTCGLSATETCSAGSSPANQTTLAISLTGSSGTLACANASTLVYAGPVTAANGNTLSFGAGCKMQHDSSWANAPTTAAYMFKWGSGSASALMNLSGTSGSHITWQGDSSLAPNPESGACSAGTCLAGSINFITDGSCPASISYGTVAYVDFANILGTAGGSTNVAICLSTGSSSSLGSINWSNITVNNSGTVKVSIQGTGDVNTIALSGWKITNCSAPLATAGCILIGPTTAASAWAGTYSVTGMTADGYVNSQQASSADPFVFRNIMLYTGQGGAFPHQTVGYSQTNGSDGGVYDQIIALHGAWNTGSTESPLVDVYYPTQMTNSVIWSDRVSFVNGEHMHFAKYQNGNLGATQTSIAVTNNFLGGLGSNNPTTALYALTSSGQPTVATTFKFSGNIQPCGIINGFGTAMMMGGYFNGATSNVSQTVSGNTICNSSNTGGMEPSMGGAGFETAAIGANTIASIDSNIFYNLVSGGTTMVVQQGPNNQNVTQPGITAIQNNAYFNASTYAQPFSGTFSGAYGSTLTLTSVANASAGSTVYTGTITGGTNVYVGTKVTITGFTNGANNGTFACTANSGTTITLSNASGVAETHAATALPTLNFVTTFGTDFNVGLRLPVMVENTRVPTLFDTEYLNPVGLLLTSSYGATAWATSTNYTTGQVVSDSQAGVLGGKTTYWRCITSHTSSSTNRPVTGNDASNPYQAPQAFWEEAFWNYVRTNVLANTTYDNYCSALLFVACPSPHTYIGGLLVAWLREGYVSMEPKIWIAGAGACSSNGGSTKQECGAVQLPLVQHIPPTPGFVD